MLTDQQLTRLTSSERTFIRFINTYAVYKTQLTALFWFLFILGIAIVVAFFFSLIRALQSPINPDLPAVISIWTTGVVFGLVLSSLGVVIGIIINTAELITSVISKISQE